MRVPTGVRRGCVAVLALYAALLCGAAQAELRALLVGVSGYPTLPEKYRLLGPRNDVQRMRDVLLQRGFAPPRIQLLADGVAGAGSPTRANIMAALAGLAASAQPGDTVFIHFAGHGSRQPADRSTPAGRDEPDGLHETFLPLDVGQWDGSTHTVANAIVDVDLRAAVDRITERGAFVWGVFDACHSATLVRGADSSQLRYRHVAPRDLGIAPADFDAAAPPATRGSRGPRPGALDATVRTADGRRGGTVFFYASQTTELTPELDLPVGDAKRQPYGLFGFMVARAIERSQPMSYRQMAQYILAEYGAIIEARATPLFSGNALDQPVLAQAAPPVRQWPLVVDPAPGVRAGSLSGIGAGAVFALLPGPLARDDEAIGYLQARAIEPAWAELAPVANAGRAAPAAADLKRGQYLRLAANPARFALRVAFNATGCATGCVAAAAVARLKMQGVPGVELQWVEAAASPDLLLQLRGTRLAMQPPTQQADDPRTAASAPGLDTAEAGKPLPADVLAERLGRELHAVARSRNLLALAARFAGEARTDGLTASLRRGGAAALSAEQVPTLHDGEQLSLVVENRGAVALDLTVLYVDADHGITALFPTLQGESNRIDAGTRQVIDGIKIGAPPAGIEHLLLIAVEARKHGERADFSFLQQPALTRQRGAASEEFEAFADAAFADYRTRGATRPATASPRTTMQVFTLNVQR